MILPDYRGGSIVNLMSSLARCCGGKTPYPVLRKFPDVKEKNIVLLVIDGLGYEYLMHSSASFIKQHVVGEMTSVFLPTTACAIPTFLTGVPPQQHGLTGWFTFLKELGVVARPLPYNSRWGGSQFHIPGRMVFDTETFFEKIERKGFAVVPKEIADDRNELFRGGDILSYATLNGFFRQIGVATRKPGKKYVYAYWSEFDHLLHEQGVGSKDAKGHLVQIDEKLKMCVKGLKDTCVIVTADHGFVDLDVISLADHPVLEECLSLPLCGDGRVVYCYVHPDKRERFELYARKKLARYCDVFTREEALKKNLYGLFEPNPKLKDRIGDYLLVCKKRYAFRDVLLGEKRKNFKANHGGVSRDEMIVPYALIRS